MEANTNETANPKKGLWDSVETYPQKVRFELNKPVVVSFDKDFTAPKEMPGQREGDSPFCIFDVTADGTKSAIMTSAMTLLGALKSHDPLAGKTLIITKKNVSGKNFFYVTTPEAQERLNPDEDEDLPDY